MVNHNSGLDEKATKGDQNVYFEPRMKINHM